ncbi:MAG: hypothetical protein QXM08_07015 [Thermofilaceae archaeon]
MLGVMKLKLLTLDAYVFVSALKADKEYSDECAAILRKLPGRFIPAEPSIVYQEVCGALARRVGMDVARKAERFLDSVLHPELVYDCTRASAKRPTRSAASRAYSR